MSILHSISILLVIAGVCSWLNHRYIKLPSAIGIMTVSLVFSLLIIFCGWAGMFNAAFATSFVASFDFEQLLLHGMLAFLLFAGGLSIDLSELNSQKGIVAVLSTVGVIISTFLTGFLFWVGLAWLGVEIPFLVALLFGAIVSPTDAVAALGILRKVQAPKSLEIKIVGESLFNDGVGVVVFFAVYSLVYGQQVSLSSVGTTLAI